MQVAGIFFNITIDLLCTADQVLLASCSISFITEQVMIITGYWPAITFPEDNLHAECFMLKKKKGIKILTIYEQNQII